MGNILKSFQTKKIANNPAKIIKANIIPIMYPNFLVPKNMAIKNLIMVFEIAARVMAVTATSGEMIVSLVRSAMLIVIASTSAIPDIMPVI